MRLHLLHETHPYVEGFDVHIMQTPNGYEVRWRDFDSVKQEASFSTLKDAEKYCELLKKTCALIDLDYYGYRVDDANKFWYGL